jgi:DNA-directed RNA polymerase II subunit RPB1
MAAHAEAQKTTGMFSDDGVRTFMSQLKTLTDDCFTELNTMVASEYTNPAERHARFKKGLNTIENWDAQVRGEETSHALERFPSINEQYKHSVIAYVKSTLSGGGGENVRVRIPPFDMFLFYLFREIARSSVMRNGEYFSMGYLDRDAYMCDIVHIVMRDCAQVISNDSQSKASTATAASSRMSSWRKALASMDDVKVLPGDSVSCIQHKRTVPVHVTQSTGGTTTHALDDEAPPSRIRNDDAEHKSSTQPEHKSVAQKPEKALTKVTDHRSVILGDAESRSVVVASDPQVAKSVKAASVAPKDPSVAPKAPSVASVAPKDPSVAPKAPSVAPKAPSVAPKDPSVAPKAPSVAPKAPSVAPKAPSVAPKAPSVAPKAPSVAPKAPSVAPAKQSSVVESVSNQEWVVERQSVAVQTIETGDAKSVATKLTVVQPPAEELLRKPPSVIITKRASSTASRSVNLDQSATGHMRTTTASRTRSSALSSSDDDED